MARSASKISRIRGAVSGVNAVIIWKFMTRRFLPALLLVAVVLGSGCLARKLRIIRRGASSSGKLATASLEQLVGSVRSWDQQVHTINATVKLEP